MKYQKKTGMSLFEQENTLESLSKMGNPLEFIKEDFVVTPASVHDSTPVGVLINTDEQKENNKNKSKTRCRIEHVYGFMEQSMKGLFFRGVGIVGATFYIGFTNFVYNMCRLVQIKRYHSDWITN